MDYGRVKKPRILTVADAKKILRSIRGDEDSAAIDMRRKLRRFITRERGRNG